MTTPTTEDVLASLQASRAADEAARWAGHCANPTPCPRPGKPCACGEEVREAGA